MNRPNGGILLWGRARVEIDAAGFYASGLYEKLGGESALVGRIFLVAPSRAVSRDLPY